MKRIALALALVILSAEPVFALCTNAVVNVAPARPTSADEVEVVLTGTCSDGCIPRVPRVTVGSGNIIIDLSSSGGCVLVPTPWGERVAVGRVAPGTHTVLIRHNGVEIARQSLVAREHPFTIRPSFGPGGTTVLLRPPNPGSCEPVPCAEPDVTFGGVPATILKTTADGDLVLAAPAHAPGLVDVVLTGRDGVKHTAGQAYLYPAALADLTSEYERVFYPIAFTGPGAHGSDWRTENMIMNRGPIDVATVPLFPSAIIPGVPVMENLQAGQRRTLDPANRDGGILFMVPKGMESWLAYSSHIMDRSRRATDAGTEIPVVHESQAGSTVTILGVPLTSESRQTLRIYDVDAVDGRAVTISVKVEGRADPVLATATLTHRVVCVTTPCYPEHPTYAVVNLDSIPELRDAGTADITIRAGTGEAPLWAFVSVTNNDTQHVTTYTPQHRRLTVP